MNIVGYTDRLSAAGDDHIAFMISSVTPTYAASLVRLIHGDTNPLGPGFKAEATPSTLDGDHPGRLQELRLGSYARVPDRGDLWPKGSFTVQLWFRPTTLSKPTQTLISQKHSNGSGFALRLEDGYFAFYLGTQCVALTAKPLDQNSWYFAAAVFHADSAHARIILDPLGVSPTNLRQTSDGVCEHPELGQGDILMAAEEIWIGAVRSVSNFFNGKIDEPRIYRRALTDTEIEGLRNNDAGFSSELAAEWNFSRDISKSTVTDVSGNGNSGVVINQPMRAATGHNWSGIETSWRHAPEQYGAIHFHDDDLSDAGWERSLVWKVPVGLRSGVYALHVRSGEDEDYIPFVVRPQSGRPTAQIALLLPTFSYLAYANEQLMMSREEDRRVGYPGCAQDRYIVENRLLSLYDKHSDGSGVCYASRLRPLVNMRPKYSMPGFAEGGGTPHQLNADLHLVDWLHQNAYDFDVVTDDDLHHDGVDLLAPYRTVITGTHCEYWSGEMLDAAQAYLHDGGHMMYLGGNGMYWVTQLDADTDTTIEVRRRGPATRTWEPAPGEAHLSSTGELGGLWRFRGRAPQSWLGVGFAAETTSIGRPYARQPASFDPKGAFVFDGIGSDELIGDFRNLVRSYGAAGYEFDRADETLGTPTWALVLATASGFSDDAQAVAEEIMLANSAQGGTVNPLVRADMVLLEYPTGGAIFSTGSITWCGCLSYNNYDNNVSRVTRNVLDRFVAAKL